MTFTCRIIWKKIGKWILGFFGIYLVQKISDVPSWPTYQPTMSDFRPIMLDLPTYLKSDVINGRSLTNIFSERALNVSWNLMTIHMPMYFEDFFHKRLNPFGFLVASDDCAIFINTNNSNTDAEKIVPNTKVKHSTVHRSLVLLLLWLVHVLTTYTVLLLLISNCSGETQNQTK